MIVATLALLVSSFLLEMQRAIVFIIIQVYEYLLTIDEEVCAGIGYTSSHRASRNKLRY